MKGIVRGGNSGAGVNMRAKASKSGSIVTVIKQGTEVQVVDVGEEWSKIKYKDKTGYIMTEYLDTMDQVADTEIADDVIKVSRSELQKAYAQIGNMLKGVKPVKN